MVKLQVKMILHVIMMGVEVMKNLDWIKDLVESERQMEESGMIDLSGIPDEQRDMELKTHEFLRVIKETFVEYATAFNNMKNAPVGNVKIYGISNTVADFMLFRNGYKLIVAMVAPGRIGLSLQSHSPTFMSAQHNPMAPGPDETLDAKYGPFGELTWTYRGLSVQVDYLVRYYLSRFVRESAK